MVLWTVFMASYLFLEKNLWPLNILYFYIACKIMKSYTHVGIMYSLWVEYKNVLVVYMLRPGNVYFVHHVNCEQHVNIYIIQLMYTLSNVLWMKYNKIKSNFIFKVSPLHIDIDIYFINIYFYTSIF